MFKTPSKSGTKLRRPMTSVTRSSVLPPSQFDSNAKNQYANSPSKSIRSNTKASGKKVLKVCMANLVKKKDRLKAVDVNEYICHMIEVSKRVKNVNQAIKLIFDKI